MKLAYFASNFVTGGESTVVVNLSREMAELGHEVSVYAPDNTPNEEFQTPKNVDVNLLKPTLSPDESNTPFSHKLFSPALTQDADIVQGFLGTPQGLYSSTVQSLWNDTPLVYFYHHDWDAKFHPDLFRKTIIKSSNFVLPAFLRYAADAIVVPSEEYAKESKYLNVKEDKLNVIHNGVKLDEWIDQSKQSSRKKLSIPISDCVVLFVGSVTKRKGIEFLIKGFQKVANSHPDARLIVVGDGDHRSKAQALSERVGIEDQIEFPGFVSKEEIKHYYNAADLFILPSIGGGECFPNVNLEAMANDLPIIATDVGGNPEIIENGENGYIIEPENSEDISEKISYLIKDKDKREYMASRNNSKIQNFQWEEIAKETENMYNEILKNR